MAEPASLMHRLPEVRGSYRPNADLSKVNWFNVGGPAEVMFRPKDIDDLSRFVANKPEDVPITVLGVGSNLLVRDGGIDGVVIRLGRGFADIVHEGGYDIRVGAGALCFNVARLSQDWSIAGLEFLAGIPGSMGGALFMNAGAYGDEIVNVFKSATAVDERGQIHELSLDDMGYVYRGNTLPDGFIITGGVISGRAGDAKEIGARIDEITTQRSETQPIRSRTSGSTFKNPAGKKAWKLIDEAGCRGLIVGKAQVSQLHCNFMINLGGATAADLENLGEEVRRRVKDHSGVELEWEVQRIGKFKDGQ